VGALPPCESGPSPPCAVLPWLLAAYELQLQCAAAYTIKYTAAIDSRREPTETFDY